MFGIPFGKNVKILKQAGVQRKSGGLRTLTHLTTKKLIAVQIWKINPP